MGRRVIFGLDLRPYLRKYVVMKLGQYGLWNTPYGFELQGGIEQRIGVQFLQLHPEEKPEDQQTHVRMRAWLPEPWMVRNRPMASFWLSRKREQQVRAHIHSIFNTELVTSVQLCGNSVEGGIRKMKAVYNINEDELDNAAMSMRYFRQTWRRPDVIARPPE